MEFVITNTLSELPQVYDYLIKETKEGRRLGINAFIIMHILLALFVIFLILISRVLTYDITQLLFILIVIITLQELLLFTTNYRNPFYNLALRSYLIQEKAKAPFENEIYQLPKIIHIDNKWITIENTEAAYKFKWRRVNDVSVKREFIFINVSCHPIITIPKRCVESEEKFRLISETILSHWKNSKDQLIGEE